MVVCDDIGGFFALGLCWEGCLFAFGVFGPSRVENNELC